MHIDMNDGPTVGISFSLLRRIVGIDAGTMADTREESNHNKERSQPVETQVEVDSLVRISLSGILTPG